MGGQPEEREGDERRAENQQVQPPVTKPVPRLGRGQSDAVEHEEQGDRDLRRGAEHIAEATGGGQQRGHRDDGEQRGDERVRGHPRTGWLPE